MRMMKMIRAHKPFNKAKKQTQGFSPNSLLWGSLLEKIGWPRYALAASRSLSTLCPACVRLVSAMCPPRVRHVSASCPPCVCLKPAVATSPNFLRHVSIVSAFCPALCPLWPRLQTLSAMCPPCLLSAMCRPCVRLVSALPTAPKLVRHVRLASTLCPPLCLP